MKILRRVESMHKSLAAVLCLLSFSGLVRASDTIELDSGILRNANGTATVPVGGLLQLIASPVTAANPDGVFTAPSASSFVTGNNILVQSFAMNNTFGTGESDNVANFTLNTGANPIVAGDALLLRWYPTLTMSSISPGSDTTYGQFRSDSPETEGGISWFVPTGDVALTYPNGLNFNTMDAGGTHAEVTGYAAFTVATVPEPSSGILCGLGVVAVISAAQTCRRFSGW